MAGEKVDREYSINTDHQTWLNEMVTKYGIKDEGKALRVILDYAIKDADEETIFKKIRCMRCSSS